MQAFANNTDEKITPKIEEDHTPLFSSNEIIFPDETVERPYTRYGYKISNMNFLVPEETVSEIIQDTNIFNLPNSPSWIEGLINLRGNIIPVMNLDKYLKKNNNKSTTILVLNNSEEKNSIALMIDELPVSLELNDSTTTTNNYPLELQDYISSGFTQNKNDWVEFNPESLFKKLSAK